MEMKVPSPPAKIPLAEGLRLRIEIGRCTTAKGSHSDDQNSSAQLMQCTHTLLDKDS